MNRRDAINRVAMIMGGTVIGAEIFLHGCKPGTPQLSNVDFTPENITFLDEVGETILPTTPSSPGAKAAKIGEFMQVIVRDCYVEADQKTFLEGVVKLNDEAKAQFGDDFLSLSPEDRQSFLTAMDKAAAEYMATKLDADPNHYFTMMKQLTLWGYFTSEVGATQALNYIETPGKWEACRDYKKGDGAWAI